MTQDKIEMVEALLKAMERAIAKAEAALADASSMGADPEIIAGFEKELTPYREAYVKYSEMIRAAKGLPPRMVN